MERLLGHRIIYPACFAKDLSFRQNLFRGGAWLPATAQFSNSALKRAIKEMANDPEQAATSAKLLRRRHKLRIGASEKYPREISAAEEIIPLQPCDSNSNSRPVSYRMGFPY